MNAKLLTRFVAGDVAALAIVMSTAATKLLSESRPFSEHDCVRLAEAHKDAGLKMGAMGAIVHVYPGGAAYEVEFTDAKEGHEVLTLESKDLVPV